MSRSDSVDHFLPSPGKIRGTGYINGRFLLNLEENVNKLGSTCTYIDNFVKNIKLQSFSSNPLTVTCENYVQFLDFSKFCGIFRQKKFTELSSYFFAYLDFSLIIHGFNIW